MYDKPSHKEKKLIDERAPEDAGRDTPLGTPAAPANPYAPQAMPDPVGRDKKAPYSHKHVKHPPHMPESGIPQEEKSDPDANIQGQVADDSGQSK